MAATFRKSLILLLLCGAATPGWPGSAKVLLYHHVSDATPASTSVTPATFDAHLDLLAVSGYRVVPLQKIVDTLLAGGGLESNWVAITFDDAYQSVLAEAAPRLAARGWPFTVFVSTDAVDAGHAPYLGWEELRSLEAAGGTLANHTLSHPHMPRRRPGETADSWRERLTREVMEAHARLQAELTAPLRLVAYPYGEFTEPVAELMRALGFVAFGQQSGPVGSTTHPYAIPRFPMATGFDSTDSLAEKLRTEHLALTDPGVPATLLGAGERRPVLTLRPEPGQLRPGSLTCFVAGRPATTVVWSGATELRVQAQGALPAGRSKYTCTAPHPEIPGAYYWHSHLFLRPGPGGWRQEG